MFSKAESLKKAHCNFYFEKRSNYRIEPDVQGGKHMFGQAKIFTVKEYLSVRIQYLINTLKLRFNKNLTNT